MSASHRWCSFPRDWLDNLPKSITEVTGQRRDSKPGASDSGFRVCVPLLQCCSKAWGSSRQTYFSLAFGEFSEIMGLRRSSFALLSTVWEGTVDQLLSSFPPATFEGWLQPSIPQSSETALSSSLSLSLSHTHMHAHTHTHTHTHTSRAKEPRCLHRPMNEQLLL